MADDKTKAAPAVAEVVAELIEDLRGITPEVHREGKGIICLCTSCRNNRRGRNK